jgi:hypothetical protein
MVAYLHQRIEPIYGGNGKGSGLPRGMILVARMAALQAEDQRRENQWHSSSATFSLNPGTVHLLPTLHGVVAKEGWLLEREQHRASAANPAWCGC